MLPIPMNDQCYIAAYTNMDPLTGDPGWGPFSPVSCRISNEAQQLSDYKGDMFVSVAKIYMPNSLSFNIKDKVKLNEISFNIKRLEEKKDLFGAINHYVVYI